MLRPESIAILAVVLALSLCTLEASGMDPLQNVTRSAALAVGVIPPSNWAPRFLKRIAWRAEGHLLNFIGLFDTCSPPDSKLSLRVLLRWKAIAACDRRSPAFEEDGITYDLLPGGFRRLLLRGPLCRLYPRWIHVIIEIRTAYLDGAIMRIRDELGSAAKIRLISMGGGYDSRCVRLRARGIIDDAVDLDLEPVIYAKTRMLDRLVMRRKKTNNNLDCEGDVILPELVPIDFNNVEDVQSTLVQIIKKRSKYGQRWHNIFLFEGVLMYLPEGIPSKLLRACCEALKDTRQRGSVVFADTLENIPNDDIDTARVELARLGWRVVEWLPKGGRTRHMGRIDVK